MRPPPSPGRRPRLRTPAGSPARILTGQGGIALVLTLLVVTLLSAMIIEFDYRTRLDVRAAANFRDAARASLLAQGAADAARAVLVVAQGQTPSHDYVDDALWGAPIAGYPVADGTISVAVVDEGGKLDLNTLVGDTGEADDARVAIYRRLLLKLLDPDQVDIDTLVDSLVDWIDSNPNELAHGAESPYYERLDPPYTCADGPLKTLDELGLVQGYTPEIIERLRPHVTALWRAGKAGRRRDADPPDGKININTASPELLTALSADMSDELAQNIIQGRPYDHVDAQQLNTVIQLGNDLSQELNKYLWPKSSYFSIATQGTVGDTARTLRVTVYRQPGSTDVIAWRAE
jgi:general secretion pathway protein K